MKSDPNDWVQNNPRLTNKGGPLLDMLNWGTTRKRSVQWYHDKKMKETKTCLTQETSNNEVDIALMAKNDIFQAEPARVGLLMTLDPKDQPPKLSGENSGRVGVKLTSNTKGVRLELDPTPNLKLNLFAAGTTIGWNDVPIRYDMRLRCLPLARRWSMNHIVKPIASDGIPLIDNKIASFPNMLTWGTSGKKVVRGLFGKGDAPNKNVIQTWRRLPRLRDDINKEENLDLKDEEAKFKLLQYDMGKTHFREEAEKILQEQKLGDNNITVVRTRLKDASDQLLANTPTGPLGIAPIVVEVVENEDKTMYSCPTSCIENLYHFPSDDIHNWWLGTKSLGSGTKKKIRDLILSKLPIAKLFAIGWPPKKFRQRLLHAHKNPRIQDSLSHNKEYCPTTFIVEGKNNNFLYAFHQDRMKWIEFPTLNYLPIDIEGMLGGEGGLLLLYGCTKIDPNTCLRLHIPPWLNQQRHDKQLYVPQHILMVCNPITKTYRFLPPMTIPLQFLAARMIVNTRSDAYFIYLMGWSHGETPLNNFILRVATYNSCTQQWTFHHKTFALARCMTYRNQFQKYDKIMPMIRQGVDGLVAIYTTGELAPDPKKPFEFKPVIISYNLDTLNWIIHPWMEDQPIPPSLPMDPPVIRFDPPTILECTNNLFAVARCFERTRAFIQVYKLAVRPQILVAADGQTIMKPSFIKYGPPMPNQYFQMNYPRDTFSYEYPMELNCVSGKGNIWIAPSNQCMIIFFNVKSRQWSNIVSMKLEQGDERQHHLGNWSFEPTIHAQV